MNKRDFSRRATMLDHFHGKPGKQPAAGGSMEGWGHRYDAVVTLMSLGQERKIRQATLDMVPVRPGCSILEVGCGTGSLTIAAKARAGAKSRVCGIDVASDMLATARAKAAKAGLDIQFQSGSIQEIPYPEASFDVVLSSFMLHHVPDPKDKQQGVAECLRVLKPGGVLLIVDVEPPHNPHVVGMASHILGPEMMGHSVSEFLPLLQNAGFDAIATGITKFRYLGYLRGQRPA
jgi:ubiquinone/menaquinone biosynthesis C-methylase UbiE